MSLKAEMKLKLRRFYFFHFLVILFISDLIDSSKMSTINDAIDKNKNTIQSVNIVMMYSFFARSNFHSIKARKVYKTKKKKATILVSNTWNNIEQHIQAFFIF